MSGNGDRFLPSVASSLRIQHETHSGMTLAISPEPGNGDVTKSNSEWSGEGGSRGGGDTGGVVVDVFVHTIQSLNL